MTDTRRREFDIVEKTGFVLLALQGAIFATMWNELGFDHATTDRFPILIMCTAMVIAGQRKLAARPPNSGAGRWIVASRVAALAMLAVGTLTVGLYGLLPEAAPAPPLVLRGVFVLMWAIIALKGAGIGKLKPGSAVGLRVPWTMQSRVAWDRAHRALGRVLFWGGLIGLATCLVVPPFASMAMWFSTVALGVAAALMESWRTWRLDPGRGRPA
jgi:uncharacterized membrane protein